MNPQVISVTEFIGIINETLGFAYPQVVVEGEVSSFKVNQGKWIFFDLKDDANIVSCFMMIHQLRLPLEDGMKVRVAGTPRVTKFSKFSLTVKAVEIAGEGQLRRAMELLRRKLEAEGVFAASRKRPLPRFPQRIGLITSGTSAAYSDFIKILNARWGGLTVELADVQVQGAAAPDQIVGALEYFNQHSQPVDVVVLIRGGGSLEDLVAFSTEPVARAVAASRTPIIVGVGHEIDTSLADYAADVRAATPTDAARLVVPDREQVNAEVTHLSHRIERSLEQALGRRQQRADRALGRLEAYLRYPRERVMIHESRLRQGLDRIRARMQAHRQILVNYSERLARAEGQMVSENQRQVLQLERVLGGFDPQANLRRGYAIVRRGDQIVRRADDLKNGDTVMLQLGEGQRKAEVSDE